MPIHDFRQGARDKNTFDGGIQLVGLKSSVDNMAQLQDHEVQTLLDPHGPQHAENHFKHEGGRFNNTGRSRFFELNNNHPESWNDSLAKPQHSKGASPVNSPKPGVLLPNPLSLRGLRLPKSTL